MKSVIAIAAFLALTATTLPALAQGLVRRLERDVQGALQEGGGLKCALYCKRQHALCRKSGCWTEGARFGHAKHCKLRKR